MNFMNHAKIIEPCPSCQAKTWMHKPFLVLLSFSFLLLLFRLVLRGHILEMDEAEQAFLAYEWHSGYPAQPPLYFWLQYVFFKIFGIHLFSMALLKYSLLFASLYCYHQLCRLYCTTLPLAWCATAAWALIPSISFDLLKDNTHTVLALLMACLSWYCFFAPSRLSHFRWYFRLGVLIGLGLLTKFNYAIFLLLLLLSALSIKELRPRIISPWFLGTLLLAALIISPYVYWLMLNASTGFSSLHKIAPADKTLFQGALTLLDDCIIFVLPVIGISALFFKGAPFNIARMAEGAKLKALTRYHLFALPFLVLFTLSFGFRYFETRWLIPIFFLVPLLVFAPISATRDSSQRARIFLVFCLSVQVCLMAFLHYRSHNGLKYDQKEGMMAELNELMQEKKANTVVSDFMWILGSLRVQSPNKRLFWFEETYQAPQLGKEILLTWIEPSQPFWIADLIKFHHWQCLEHKGAYFSYCLIENPKA